MRIGIDARFLTHPQVGGFKTYTENLINALSQVDDTNQYVIYLDRPPNENDLHQKKNFTYRIVDGTLPGVGMPIREQITLRHHILKDKVDLVHFLCNTAPLKPGSKFVVTLHDTIQVTNPLTPSRNTRLSAHKRWAISAYSKWSILKTVEAAQKVITVSNFEKTQIAEQLNIERQRICVTHLAANPVFVPASQKQKGAWRTQMRQQLGLPERFILGVGYEVRKNVPLLINAFAQIASDEPDLGLVIVAAQPKRRQAFQRLATTKNLSDRVLVLAAHLPSELAVLYNLAEVFVFPSERESFGLPPLEAMACGTPTITMNMSSIPEIVQNGALLVDSKIAQHWAEAIKQVLTLEELRKSLAERGLRQAAKFKWQRCARETIKVYQAVFEQDQVFLKVAF